MMARWLLVLALGCSSVLAAQVVRAQSDGDADDSAREASSSGGNEPGEADREAARVHFKNGVDYYRDGDLEAAMIEFKRAYTSAPNYKLLFNLGQVSEELRNYPGAERFFQEYLREGGSEIPSERQQEVRLELSKLATRIASLVLTSNVENAEYFIDDSPVGKGPLKDAVKVSAGRRRVTATAPNRARVSQVVDVTGGETHVVNLNFGAEMVGATPTTVAAPRHGLSPVVWLGIGTGALALGSGIMAYLTVQDSNAYSDALQRTTTRAELDKLKSHAETKALVTDIFLGATVAAGVTTLVLALTNKHHETAQDSEVADARPRLEVGPGSLMLHGMF